MNVLNRLKRYLGNRKTLLPLSLAASALNGFLSLAPFLFVWLIVKILLDDSQPNRFERIYAYAWWAFGLCLLSIIVYFSAICMSHLAAFRIENNLRRSAMKRIINLPIGFFDTETTGRIRKIVDENATQTHTFIAHVLPDLAGSIISPLCVLALIFVFDWRLGLSCLFPILFSFGVMSVCLMPRFNKFQGKYMDAQESMSNEAVEYVRGIPVVKIFQQSVFSFRRFHNSIMAYRDLVIKYTRAWKYPMSIYTAVIQGFAYFLIPTAILLIHRGGDSLSIIADVFLYLLITPVISSNVMKIMYLGQSLREADQALTRIERLTQDAPVLQDEGTQTTNLQHFDIRFEHVSFSYPGIEKKAADDVSFTLPEGKTFALVGPSGGGKTTLARLIPRFWDAKEGAVFIGGRNVKSINQTTLMENISFVFQNTKLFKTSIAENITYGKKDASKEEIARAIELSQSREIIDKLPDGIDTLIGAEGTYLSGGEQQRILLARAFLKDAPIIVLDEATAFADPENEHIIQKAINLLIKGKTVLLIAHRLTTVRHADKILVIRNGKIAEQGSHNDLLAQKGIYSDMWQEYQQAVNWTI